MSPEPEEEKDVVVEIVDLGDIANVQYWCSRWNVTEQELGAAVKHAGGGDAPSVSLALGKEAP